MFPGESFKLFGCAWQVIRSTPNFVAAKEVHRLRPFTVFRYSLQNDTFGRDFSAPESIGDFYVSIVGEYTHRSTAIRSLKTLEDQLQSYRKFFGNRRTQRPGFGLQPLVRGSPTRDEHEPERDDHKKPDEPDRDNASEHE